MKRSDLPVVKEFDGLNLETDTPEYIPNMNEKEMPYFYFDKSEVG